MARTSLLMHRAFLASLACFIMSLGPTQSAPDSAFITHIPGFSGTIPSKHYSGYVTVDENHGRNLFYYFVESERSPSEDPVVLWLNGGPGCSSLGGYIYEHGPFKFEKAKTKGSLPQPQLNPYSWSKVSNILYLDIPAGTGYSYSKNRSDYETSDRKTASDSHKFLLKFLSNPFFIAGESYAGYHVPSFTYEVVKGIDAGIRPLINLKDYLVGNGLTDEEIDGNAVVPFAYGMGLLSYKLFQEVKIACGGNYYNPPNSNCEAKVAKVNKAIAGLNKYNILEPCHYSPGPTEITTTKSKMPESFRQLGETDSLLKSSKIPCTDVTIATTWLNDEAVRKALHVAEENLDSWELCTDRLSYWRNIGSMIPYHRNLTSRGYPVLIYSGNHDMCAPYTGTEAWIRSLGYEIVDEWRPWFSNEQVAGYTQGYEHNLTFATVKGCGHTVPEYKPREALDLYSRFLAGKPL